MSSVRHRDSAAARTSNVRVNRMRRGRSSVRNGVPSSLKTDQQAQPARQGSVENSTSNQHHETVLSSKKPSTKTDRSSKSKHQHHLERTNSKMHRSNACILSSSSSGGEYGAGSPVFAAEDVPRFSGNSPPREKNLRQQSQRRVENRRCCRKANARLLTRGTQDAQDPRARGFCQRRRTTPRRAQNWMCEWLRSISRFGLLLEICSYAVLRSRRG